MCVPMVLVITALAGGVWEEGGRGKEEMAQQLGLHGRCGHV